MAIPLVDLKSCNDCGLVWNRRKSKTCPSCGNRGTHIEDPTD